MNFLDAHDIVHALGTAVGKGATSGFFRISSYPYEFNKDKIINAFKIFFAHMILFKTRSNEEVNNYLLVLQSIDLFKPEEELKKMKVLGIWACKKGFLNNLLYGSKIDAAKKEFDSMLKSYTESLKSYKYDEVCSYFDSLLEYYRELLSSPKPNNISSDDDYIIDTFSQKAYQLANIEYKDEYFYYFQPFNVLRKALTMPEYRNYYKGYENYINTNK